MSDKNVLPLNHSEDHTVINLASWKASWGKINKKADILKIKMQKYIEINDRYS